MYFYDLGNYVESINHAKKSLALTPVRNLAHRYNQITDIYMATGELDSALHWAKKSLEGSQQLGIDRSSQEAYNNLKDIYEERGEFKEALKYHKLHYQVETKDKSFATAMEIGKINTRNEVEKAASQQEIADEKLGVRTRLFIGAVVLLLMMIGLVAFIYNRLQLIAKQKREIEIQKDRAEQSERYKEEFLANMSHEIRTPIHAISGMLKILIRNQHPKFQDKFLDAMAKSTDNLSKLLNDVLDLSKIESGKLTLAEEPLALKETVMGSIDLLKERAEEKGLVIKSSFSENLPEMVVGDSLRMTQVLINLISNAIKFSEEGTISVLVTKNDEGINFEVSDEGIGISKGDQKLIFGSFEQVGSMQSIQGTGLGLTISKRLVELQLGEIRLESEMGKGSSFSFILPLKAFEGEVEASVKSETELMEIGKGLKGLKVLLAEDTEFNVMVAKDDITWYFPDAIVDVAQDGQEAVELYSNNKYDLVLMDVQMPKMDGYESTVQIREFEKQKNQERKPVIAMTASLLEKDIQKCFQSGMDDYLPKPYLAKDLVFKIRERVELE